MSYRVTWRYFVVLLWVNNLHNPTLMIGQRKYILLWVADIFYVLLILLPDSVECRTVILLVKHFYHELFFSRMSVFSRLRTAECDGYPALRQKVGVANAVRPVVAALACYNLYRVEMYMLWPNSTQLQLCVYIVTNTFQLQLCATCGEANEYYGDRYSE